MFNQLHSILFMDNGNTEIQTEIEKMNEKIAHLQKVTKAEDDSSSSSINATDILIENMTELNKVPYQEKLEKRQRQKEREEELN